MPSEPAKASQSGLARQANNFIVPATVAEAGDQASKRFVEFFTAAIRNPHARKA
jgi:hypothetical protein